MRISCYNFGGTVSNPPYVMHKRPINIKKIFNSDFDFSDSSLLLDSPVAENEMSRPPCLPESLNFYSTAHFYFFATAHWHILFCPNTQSQSFCKTKRANFAIPAFKILESISYMGFLNKKGGVSCKN